MAQTLPDLLVPSDHFIDVNTLSGVPVGVAMTVINKGTYNIILQESTLQPDADSGDGVILTNVYAPYARGDVRAGSIKIWARALGNGISCNISVQSA